MAKLKRTGRVKARPKSSCRISIPKSAQTKVLKDCRRRCALCFGLKHDMNEKAGQIDHIDGNPANNEPTNLVYLCLEHHDVKHRRSPLSKALTAGEIQAYRDELVAAAALNRTTGSPLASNTREDGGKSGGTVSVPYPSTQSVDATRSFVAGVINHVAKMFDELPHHKAMLSPEEYERHMVTVMVNAGNAIDRARRLGSFDAHVDLLTILDGVENRTHLWRTGNLAVDRFQGFWFWLKARPATPDSNERGDYREYALQALIGILNDARME